MKKKLSAIVLSVLLLFSMMAGTTLAAGSPVTAQAESNQAEIPQNRVWDLASDTVAERPSLEGETGSFDGIKIDATSGKFSPRGGDTQINAGTKLTIPVAANTEGGTLVLYLSGGSASVEANGSSYASSNSAISVPVAASETDTECTVTFTSQAYLSSIELSYAEPAEVYPGVPESVSAEDFTCTFESAEDLLDASGSPVVSGTLEGARGLFGNIKIDASAGKFAVQPANARVQINVGTVLYIPAAYDAKGATLLIAGTADGSTPSDLLVNGKSYTTNEKIDLDMTEEDAYPQYLKVEFQTQSYVTQLQINYASDSDFGTPETEAVDKTWDFTESSAVERPTVQGSTGIFDGIQIDAVTGKFAPRTSSAGGNDTQVAAGTTLYIPVAPDPRGASITVSGNNYNNLTVLLDGTEISVGKETALPAVTENTYLPLSFTSADGNGSCYLTGITIDYMSDNDAEANTVTVGHGKTFDYETIQAALDANESSASRPLVLLIAPGTYTEKITVDKPWVSFQSMYSNGGAVVIEESYYSSNTFSADGTFIPQDEYDVGTDQCGTVLLTANATGFSASGITFQNSYNITDHTGAGEQTPAVAFGSAADKVYLSDCRFIGRQDTLYLHGAGCRVFAENCYVEGTVDFVFGDADAYFTDSVLHMAGFAGRDTGYYTAANTKKGNIGFVFYNCSLTADDSYGEGSTVSLGRPWQTECYAESGRTEDGSSYVISETYDPEKKNPAYESTSSAATFIECTMDSAIQKERWNVWTRKDENGKQLDMTYHDDVRFAEINSKDTSGAYLDPADYPDIVLGTMATETDSASLVHALLDQMGFGSEIGEWEPSFTDYSTTLPQVIPPVAEEGNGSITDSSADQENHTGSSSTTNETNSVHTGDASRALLWAILAAAAAGTVFGVRKFRSNRS